MEKISLNIQPKISFCFNETYGGVIFFLHFVVNYSLKQLLGYEVIRVITFINFEDTFIQNDFWDLLLFIIYCCILFYFLLLFKSSGLVICFLEEINTFIQQGIKT